MRAQSSLRRWHARCNAWAMLRNHTSATRPHWLLRCALVGCGSLGLATFGPACGGNSISEGTRSAAESGGSDSLEGVAGSSAGQAQAGAGGIAAGGSAGNGTAGSNAGQGGGGASAGQGGGGASAGQGGSGGGGDGGNAGLGQGGGSPVCRARPPQVCAGGPITLAKTCVPEALATVGSSLPLDRCQALCIADFMTFSCSVAAVDQTTITVQCLTGCPATQ